LRSIWPTCAAPLTKNPPALVADLRLVPDLVSRTLEREAEVEKIAQPAEGYPRLSLSRARHKYADRL